jgi:ABC-2 type transport system ATP-binding protein
MRDLLIELAGQGKTLMVTSHILPELARICHQVAIITHGKLRAFGTVEEIGQQVSQQRTIEIHLVSANQVSPVAKAIRKLIEADAEVVEAHTEATVRFRTARSETELGDILRQLVKAGANITQFREVQTDLEEAFMSFARPQAATPEKPPVESGARVHA